MFDPLTTWIDNKAILLYGYFKGGTLTDEQALSGTLNAVPQVEQADFNKFKVYFKIILIGLAVVCALWLFRQFKKNYESFFS